MIKKIYIDAGHDTLKNGDPGAVGYVTESKVNVKVVKYACEHLEKNYVCEVYQDISADSTYEISARANRWKADLFVSVHFNAGGGDGYECYLYDKSNLKLGQCFERHVKATGQNSRGVKYDPTLNVLRLTNMKAILNEIAFVDNKKDIQDWDEDSELRVMGKALAEACADWLNLPKKKEPPKYETLYRMNMRMKNDLKSDVINIIPAGKKLTGTVVSGNWLKTTYEKKTGYVRIKGSKVYLKKM